MKITVYHFRYYERRTDESLVSERKMSADGINALPRKGQIMPETAEEIDESELDEYGRYDPRKA
jgi:hypothetical protein